MDEFSLIKTLLQPLECLEADSNSAESSFLKKIGDDAAVWKGQGNLAFSIDTLVEGVHFTPDIPPEDLGYRCLAVNLSDLAAMSATPSFFTLALTLPSADEGWLRQFVQGMRILAEQYSLPLVGGDTTRGPLTITIQAHGLCDRPVYRSGAQIGDDLYVSGSLGDAAAGLALWLEKSSQLESELGQALLKRFHRPTPRVQLGEALADIATSMLDISDGLLADAQHIADASEVDLWIDAEKLPYSKALQSLFDLETREQWALSGGDDYELLFSAPSQMQSEVEFVAKQTGVAITKIGSVRASESASPKVILGNASCSLQKVGYNHFSD